MKAILKHQTLLKSGVILGVGSLMAWGLWGMLDDAPASLPSSGEVSVKVDTTLPISPQEVFHHKIESETDRLSKTIEVQGKLLEEVIKRLESLTRKPDEDLALKIKDLERRLSEQGELPPQTNAPIGLIENRDPSKQGIQRLKVNLAPNQAVKTGKTVDTTIPAGSFVKALILGGVAASTSITAAQNPKPVLLNLVEDGQLPRGFFQDLKDCRLTASSYGDLSSERVAMRLEKLSCVERATGEIIEATVSGHVVGEDGFEGVKGAMVDRTGPRMRNSFVASFLGHLSSALGQYAMQNPLLSTPLGIQQTPPSASQLFQQGAGKGGQGAMDKYVDFQIKRAEQMQPVLYVRAGRHVDVVFTESVSLGNTLIRQALTQSKEGARLREARKVVTPHTSSSVQNAAQSIGQNAGRGSAQTIRPNINTGEEHSW